MTDEQRIVDLNIKLGEVNRQLKEAEQVARNWRERYEKYVRDNRNVRVEAYAAKFLAGMLANPGTNITNERAMVLAIGLAMDFIKEIDKMYEDEL